MSNAVVEAFHRFDHFLQFGRTLFDKRSQLLFACSHARNAQPMNGESQSSRSNQTKRVKTVGLIEIRRQGESKGGPRLVPNPIVVTSPDLKHIITRRKTDITGKTARACVFPLSI